MSLLWRSLRGVAVHHGFLHARCAGGVALGVAAVFSFQIINQNALAAFSARVDAVSQNADLLVRAGRDVLPEKALAEVLSDRDVDSAQPIHKVEVAHFDSDGTKRYLDVLGLNLAVPGSLPLSGAPDSLGEILAVRGWSALPPELADELGLEVGDRFRVVAGTRAVELRMSATVDFRRIAPLASSRLLVMDIAQSQDLFQERGVIDEINVFLVKGASARVAQERLRSKLGDVASIMTPGERRQQAEGLLRAFRLNLTALSLISLLVGLFLVYTTIQATLVRRRRELGVLRSLGATRGQVLRLLLTEAAVVGLIGTLIGLPIGWFAATLNVETVSGTLRDIYLLDELERLVVPTWIYVLAACLGLGGAVLGALLPSIDAAKREPRELLGRSSLADTSSRWSPRLAVLGGALLATVSIWYVLVGQTHGYAGFVLAAALLLSIPLLTPFVMRAISARAPADSLGAAYAIRTLQGGRAQSSALTVAALGIVRRAQGADAVVRLQSEAERGQARVARRARGVRAMALEALAQRQRRVLPLRLGQVVGPGRRRRRGAPEQHLQDPLAAPHGRGARRLARREQDARVPDESAPRRRRERHAPPAVSRVGQRRVVPELVERGEAGIHEGLVAVDEVPQVAPAAHRVHEHAPRLLAHRTREASGEARVAAAVGALASRDRSELEPLFAEALGERVGARVGQHFGRDRAYARRCVEVARGRARQQRVVGDGAPEEPGQARRDLLAPERDRSALVRRDGAPDLVLEEEPW